MTDKLTNDRELVETFMGGGILTSAQIKKRVRDWGIPYTAKKGLYIFDGDEFGIAYQRNELESFRDKKVRLQRAAAAAKKKKDDADKAAAEEAGLTLEEYRAKQEKEEKSAQGGK
jgi:hypothetical protein